MNIFWREIKANFRSLLLWGVIVVLLALEGFAEFSAYADNPELLAILDSMPQSLLDAFNMRAFNLTTVSGFYGVMFIYFALLLSIAAAMWGSDVITKEERDKTAEFALTLPVTRSRLVTAKILAVLVNCLGLLLITWGAVAFNARSYRPDAEFYRFLRLSMLALFFLQLIFLALGVFLGCAMRRYKRAGAMAVAVLLISYFFSIISAMHEKLEWLKYLSPFRYFDAAVLLHESRMDPLFIGLSIGIVVCCLAGAYFFYARRDIYI